MKTRYGRRSPAPILALLCLCLCLPARAEVYRYVDPQGVVHYTDQPPSKDARPAKLPPLQVIGPPPGPPADRGADADARPKAPQAPVELRITAPAPEQTFRGDDRRLMVNVALDRPLPEGYGLLYMLDGSPQNTQATRTLSYVLEGVERGEHLVSVAAVDARGREVARTAPVIVHMKPPTVRLTQDR